MKHLQVLAGLFLALVAASAHAVLPTTYFIYDESGHVIGEYDANGNPVQEHVYLGNQPVAVVQGGAVDNVTTDQLNTPRAVTNSSQQIVWQWSSDPFGNGAPAGSLTYNLRFPGQYFDSETGHDYNYFRDYDSSTGRYSESDPIGLRGGLNTYAYVLGNPLKFADPRGLEAPCPSGNYAECYGGSQSLTPFKKCTLKCNLTYQPLCTAAGVAGALFTSEIGGVGGIVTGGWCIVVKAVACYNDCTPTCSGT